MEKRDPGPRRDINMYTESHLAEDAAKLPLNLLDALRALDGSQILRNGLGDETVDAIVKLRTADWHDYTRHLTDWERDKTLDC